MKKVVAAGAIAATLFAPSAHAGLQEAVRGMYMSTVTNPQAINTMKMGGFYAGQISLRGPGRSFTVVQFAPPKINAGCGGIDIFFGAFSFINGQQFEQMIRSIIAAVPSLVLRMAISQMCEECGKIIDKLQEFANSVNQLGRQTCQMAGYLFDKDSRTAVDGALKNVQSAFENLTGAVSDALSGRAKAETKSTGESAEKVADSPQMQDSDTPIGDLVCKAIKQNENAIKTLDGYFSVSEMRSLITGLLGTVVYPSSEMEKSQVCPSNTPKAGCTPGSARHIANTVSKVEDLFRDRDPEVEPLRFLVNPTYGEFSSSKVCSLDPVETTDSTWRGLRYRIRTALFGASEPFESGSLSPSSVVYDVLYGTNSMSAEGQKILQTFGGNLPTLIREAHLAGGEGFAVIVADHYITNFIIPSIEYHIAIQINRAVNLIFSDRKGEGNAANPSKAEPIQKRRQEIAQELEGIVSRYRSTSALDAHNRAIWAIQLHQQLKAPQGNLKK